MERVGRVQDKLGRLVLEACKKEAGKKGYSCARRWRITSGSRIADLGGVVVRVIVTTNVIGVSVV